MTALAFGLVLTAALLHATWNLSAKQAGGGVAFVWLFSALAAVIWAPPALITLMVERPRLGAGPLIFLACSPVLNVIYYLLLQRGYRSGDFSLVYPLVRGTAPVLTMAGAVVLFEERPAPLALMGTVLIVAGVVLLVSGGRAGRAAPSALGFALLTGASISAYTLWDKYAVSGAGVPPAVLNWAIYLGQTAMLAPLAVSRRRAVGEVWRTWQREALTVAVLSPLAYLLVLTALVASPVSHVAPLRELSILIGVVMGSRLLAERHLCRRLVGAGVMIAGVIGLALA
jgi:drug/metabolite transporter (DMT)-like permease